MKKRFALTGKMFFLLGMVCWLSACAVPSLVIKINTSHDPGATFSEYRTFNWYAPEGTTGSTAYSSLDAHLRKAIGQEISKKGLQQTNDKPELLLAYDVSLAGAAPTTAPAMPTGFGYGLASQMGYQYSYGHLNIANYKPVNAYGPGTLLIDVVDAQTKELVWRGWAEEVITDYDADFKTVENFVDDILDKYPPQ